MVIPYYFKLPPDQLRPRTRASWSQSFREITIRLVQRAKGYSLREKSDVVERRVMATRKRSHAHS